MANYLFLSTIKLPTSYGSSKMQESSRKTSISALLTMPLIVWITINWKIREMGIPDQLTCLLTKLVLYLSVIRGLWSKEISFGELLKCYVMSTLFCHRKMRGFPSPFNLNLTEPRLCLLESMEPKNQYQTHMRKKQMKLANNPEIPAFPGEEY